MKSCRKSERQRGHTAYEFGVAIAIFCLSIHVVVGALYSEVNDSINTTVQVLQDPYQDL